MAAGEDDDEFEHNKFVKSYTDKKATIVNILCDKKFEREGKLNELNISLNANFPKLEGDKCTFIGCLMVVPDILSLTKPGEQVQKQYKTNCFS